MTAEQEQAINDANAILAKQGLTIETVIEIDSEGQKIGLPMPPRPKK